jgi:hypothetical protein
MAHPISPILLLAALALGAGAPGAARAAGGHEKLKCTGCHAMHAGKGRFAAAVAPNTKMVNPKTGRAHEPITALCLGCHADAADGGKGWGSISNHLGHPFSVTTPNPRLARVPEPLLRDGHFECVSCHDPHPSNPNYRYLRVTATNQAPSMSIFCGICHPRKADPNARLQPLFDSMDETAGKHFTLQKEP